MIRGVEVNSSWKEDLWRLRRMCGNFLKILERKISRDLV